MKDLSRCGFHHVVQVLFLTLLAFSLVSILVMLAPTTFRLIHSKVSSRRPLTHRVSGHLRTAQTVQTHSLLTRLSAAATETRAASPNHTARHRSIAKQNGSNFRLVPHGNIAQSNVSAALSHHKYTEKYNAFISSVVKYNVSIAPVAKHNVSIVPVANAPVAKHVSNASVLSQKSPVNRSVTVPVPAQTPVPNKTSLEVTVPITGQLGNHMFEYASLLGIAHMNGRKPFYRSSSRLQDTFRVTHIEDRSDKGFSVVSEKDFAVYTPSFEHLPNQNVLLVQYLQSWKYFDAIKSTIKQEFKFKQRVKDRVAGLLAKMAPQTGQLVKIGVHVRRGDLTLLSGKLRGYHIAPASYLFKAMNYMRKKHGEVIFLVVSDDPEWCKDKLRKVSDSVVVDWAAAEVHMALLATCDHVIMTVGTFGWWGGYLGGGDVVYYWDPKECLHHPPMPVEIKKPEDFFLPSWIPLPG